MRDTQGDEAYQCVFECEDDQGQHGVRLSKQIVTVAGKSLQDNFTMLGPYVLPLSEQVPTIKVSFKWLVYTAKSSGLHVGMCARG